MFFWAKFIMLTVFHYQMVLKSYICIEIKYRKSSINVLNQNVNVTKTVKFATFAVRIVDNFC